MIFARKGSTVLLLGVAAPIFGLANPSPVVKLPGSTESCEAQGYASITTATECFDRAPTVLTLTNVKTLENHYMHFVGCLYNSESQTVIFGENGDYDVWQSEHWHYICKCPTSMNKVQKFFDEQCLGTNTFEAECPLHAADKFLQNYMTGYQFHNQIISVAASFGYVILAFAGGFPDLRHATEDGAKVGRTRVAFCVWVLLQVATCVSIVLALVVIVFDYSSATSILSDCLRRMDDGTPVFHLVAVPGFFLLPTVINKALVLNLTVLSLLCGFVHNGWIGGKIEQWVRCLCYLWLGLCGAPTIYFICTASFAFSIFSLPVCIITFVAMILIGFIIEFLRQKVFKGEPLGATFWMGRWENFKGWWRGVQNRCIIWSLWEDMKAMSIVGKFIYGMLLWTCLGPFMSSSYMLAFVCYFLGAGAEYDEWLHEFYKYIFFDLNKIMLPDTMDFLEAFSSLESLPDVMEKVTELAESFGEAEPSSLFVEATRLGEISLAFSIIKVIATSANFIVTYLTEHCGDYGVPMKDLGTLIMHSAGIEDIEDTEEAKSAVQMSKKNWFRLPHTMRMDPSVLQEFFNVENEYLDLSNHNLGDEDMQKLVDALKENETLKKLSLESNQIGDDGAKALADGLKEHTTLQEIHLDGNEISDEKKDMVNLSLTCYQMSQAFQNSSSSLNLIDRKLKDAGAAKLAEMLQENTSMYVVDLTKNEIGEEGAKALFGALEKNNTLHTLLLRDNLIGPGAVPGAAQQLALALEGNTSLKHLDLVGNDIRLQSSKVFDALKKNKTLQKFDLTWHDRRVCEAESMVEGCCTINMALQQSWKKLQLSHPDGRQPEWIEKLADMLPEFSSLEHLVLRRSNINNDGAKALAKGLETNTTVELLDLSWNKFNDEGAEALGKAFGAKGVYSEWDKLKCLNLEGNSLGERALFHFPKQRWEEVNLSQNKLGDDCAKQMAYLIEGDSESSLRELNLSSNNIGNDGSKALFEALRDNKKLQKLELWCGMNDDGAKALINALARNTTLQELRLFTPDKVYLSEDLKKKVKEMWGSRESRKLTVNW